MRVVCRPLPVCWPYKGVRQARRPPLCAGPMRVVGRPPCRPPLVRWPYEGGRQAPLVGRPPPVRWPYEGGRQAPPCALALPLLVIFQDSQARSRIMVDYAGALLGAAGGENELTS